MANSWPSHNSSRITGGELSSAALPMSQLGNSKLEGANSGAHVASVFFVSSVVVGV